ncbi:BS16 [Acholeplasma oculi]|uniref:Small ribosomal subunit protein uS17 n=1 Tax=Acholeplasma oculi TaxID=35623 RepID=A0A061AC75_9MOLU|nr:30S ribosomal protein S17 [Acholeplasma oculi]CDR31433.1 30S ribosomal protein S17 [Acholeplasma oculi]SKC39980.1 small subunit ribosomal protein S17 [Acholeplasma oculi]SUT92027.1 BS16 [Acholeplasma oculi]
MEKAKSKKLYTGTVVSDKMDKTITVLVETHKLHPIYGKRVKVSKKFHAHDEKNVAKMGDTVTIAESRPLSKTKTFVLVEVVKTAEIV